MIYTPVSDALGILPYLAKRHRYFRSLRPAVDAPPIVEAICEELRGHGIAIIKGFLSPDIISDICDCATWLGELDETGEGDRALFYPNAHQVPGFEPFFAHPLLYSVASRYIDRDVIALRQLYERRQTRGAMLACDRMYHMDSWKHRLKAFLFLHDVTERDAPLSYVKGSHVGAWRWPMEARIDRNYQINALGYAARESLAYLGCFWPYEVEAIKGRNEFEEVSCVGPAGTLVLFDARGLHRATELCSDRREILISYWVRRHHHI